MPGIPIIFAETVAPNVSEHDRRRIDAALRRIAIGDPSGRWQERPDAILVTAMLTDGRSGALVVRLEAQYGTQRRCRIAKVSSLASARAEWRAFNDVLKPVPSILCPPIEAVTEGVLDPGLALPGEDEAVIYTDVEQFAGAAACNLEYLVATAGSAGADRAVAVISRLFHLAGDIFYSDCDTASTLRERLMVNLSLGPDLELDAIRYEDQEVAADGQARSARWLPPAAVLAAGATCALGTAPAAVVPLGCGTPSQPNHRGRRAQ